MLRGEHGSAGADDYRHVEHDHGSRNFPTTASAAGMLRNIAINPLAELNNKRIVDKPKSVIRKLRCDFSSDRFGIRD